MTLKYIALSLVAASAISATAQTELVNGYFRVKTGSGNYLAVTGPFTANANLSLAQAEMQPGSIFRISAYQDGNSYRLTNLGAQGIDLAKDTFFDQHPNADLFDLFMNDDYNSPTYAGDILHGMVQQGYRYGYTAVARATLATAFKFVAGKLENYGDKVEGYTPDEFNNVTDNFTKNVLHNLDLGLRMVPVTEGGTDEMYIYVDMPEFQDVVDWYTDQSTDETKARHDSFYRATLAMNEWLGVSYEHPTTGKACLAFWPEAVDLLKDWGYDIAAAYPDNAFDISKVEGMDMTTTSTSPVVLYTFDEVFSNRELLFNWVKFMFYTILHPETDIHDVFEAVAGKFGDYDMAKLMNEHTITSFIYQQLPYFQSDSRIYFVAGNVVNGTYNAVGYHLGFAVENNKTDRTALALAGNNGKWILEPVTDQTRIFVDLQGGVDGMNYGAFVFDFPVTVQSPGQLYSLSEEKTAADPSGALHTFVELVEEDSYEANVPFIVGHQEEQAVLLINEIGSISPLEKVEEPEPESPKIVIGDDVVVKQHIGRGPALAADASTGRLKGTLMTTSSNNLQQLWGTEFQPITYSLGNTQQASGTATDPEDNVEKTWTQSTTHNGFAKVSDTLNANQAVYVPSADKTNNQVLIGEPNFEFDTATTISKVEVNENCEYFSLQGIRVERPLSGNIYICRNGNTARKVIIK